MIRDKKGGYFKIKKEKNFAGMIQNSNFAI